MSCQLILTYHRNSIALASVVVQAFKLRPLLSKKIFASSAIEFACTNSHLKSPTRLCYLLNQQLCTIYLFRVVWFGCGGGGGGTGGTKFAVFLKRNLNNRLVCFNFLQFVVVFIQFYTQKIDWIQLASLFCLVPAYLVLIQFFIRTLQIHCQLKWQKTLPMWQSCVQL